MQQKNSILNTFKCQKIFLNIDQIMQVNNDFLKDLLSIPNTSNFGILCEKHINKFECYRKYLLEQSEAQKLHAKEYKTNQSYKRFISKVKEVPAFKRKRLQDILVEPVQRISRYSMMLRDILQLTPEDHPEFRGLKAACEKASEIATMADDDPTKTATMFLNLYQAIKDSPCSLINQKRSLIAHLDAIEIHRVTNKPTRAVSIFLFTDKILVASRSSIDAKEINLQQILDSTNTICPTNSSSASLLFSSNSNHHKSDKHHLKFKGWVDIESIEMFEGVPERQGSFILSATSAPETQRDEVSNITSFEKYFYKGPRLFTVIPTREENSLTKAKRTSYVEKMLEFRSLFQKTRALMKRYEPSDKTYHRVWNGVPVYCNVYSQESYTKARYKNDSTVIYVDGDDQYAIEPEDLFSTRSSLYNPWVVSLIQPEEMKGFRFNICTKTSFPTACIGKKSTENTTDFERIFWNNIFYLNQCLKRSQDYATHSILRIQQALSHNVSRSRSKSKSISRTSSIPSIGKLFHNNSGTNNSRPRSVSPSRMLIKSSKSTQSLVASSKYAPVHHSWSSGSVSSSSHPDSYRHNSSSVTTLASSLWSTPSSYHLPQVNSGDAKEEDQHTNNSPEQQSLTTDRVRSYHL
ncbi:MAG: hypothetical protein EXX96DRAFT_101325 [Benjaminiella poitrasii]|nr:MAG: hypothetical protein EXX96DRAFT_101325 [Benjaminiella poitrasii]